MEINEEILNLDLLVAKLREADTVLFFTGSGVSAESGIPTFRGASSSWWSNRFVLGFFGTPVGWTLIPSVAWFAYDNYMRKQVLMAKPNNFHTLPKFLVDRGKKVHVITENVDGLHQKGGLSDLCISEIHGTLWKNICVKCHHIIFEEQPTSEPNLNAVPYCINCGGYPRPAALLFSLEGFKETLKIESNAIPANIYKGGNIVAIIAGLSGQVKSADMMIGQCSFKIGQENMFNINPFENEYNKAKLCTPVFGKAAETAKKIMDAFDE